MRKVSSIFPFYRWGNWGTGAVMKLQEVKRMMSLRVYLSTLNNTGVQPQQDLGIPSGWTASVREMKVKGKRKRLIFFGAQRGARMQSAFSPEWRRWAPFRLGLISPGRKVNSESLCAPGNQPEKKKGEREKERERKRERMTRGGQALMKPGLQLYF